jgi:hypothetical protein
VLAALVAACGTSRGKSCTITVESITAELPNGHATLAGSFDAGQPLVVLTMAGMSHIIMCTVAGATADCDIAGAALAPGSYDLAFDVTCNDANIDVGMVVDHAATTFVVN